MYKVYGRPGLGNAIVEALLEEAGAPYTVEFVEKDAAGKFPSSFTALNPMAKIPVLILPDGQVMTESAAMAIYIADKFPAAGLAPGPEDPQRGPYLRWMLFLAANIYITNLCYFYPARYVDDESAAPAVKNAAMERLIKEWLIYATALGEKPYILGQKMSAVDIYAAVLASWSPDLPAFFAKHPNIKRMYDNVTSHPGIAKVFKRNEM
jgi:glutathione S-transferase